MDKLLELAEVEKACQSQVSRRALSEELVRCQKELEGAHGAFEMQAQKLARACLRVQGVRRPRDLQVKLQIALAEAHSEEAVQDVQKLRKAVDGEVVQLRKVLVAVASRERRDRLRFRPELQGSRKRRMLRETRARGCRRRIPRRRRASRPATEDGSTPWTMARRWNRERPEPRVRPQGLHPQSRTFRSEAPPRR